MGVSVWENHEDLELVDRAACHIPISGIPKLVPWALAATSALSSDFVVLVLSEAVLSDTVLVLVGCLKLRRCRSMIEAVHRNLRTNRPDSYTRSLRVRVPSAAAD